MAGAVGVSGWTWLATSSRMPPCIGQKIQWGWHLSLEGEQFCGRDRGFVRDNFELGLQEDREEVSQPWRASLSSVGLAASAKKIWPPADGIVLGFLLTLAFVGTWLGPRLGGGVPRGDSVMFFIPMFSFLGKHLRAFDIPGWNPCTLPGAPFAGDPESGWMYLPAMVFFLVLPPVSAYAGFVAFHLVRAGFSAYALGRILGLGVVGAAVTGMAISSPHSWKVRLLQRHNPCRIVAAACPDRRSARAERRQVAATLGVVGRCRSCHQPDAGRLARPRLLLWSPGRWSLCLFQNDVVAAAFDPTTSELIAAS